MKKEIQSSPSTAVLIRTVVVVLVFYCMLGFNAYYHGKTVAYREMGRDIAVEQARVDAMSVTSHRINGEFDEARARMDTRCLGYGGSIIGSATIGEIITLGSLTNTLSGSCVHHDVCWSYDWGSGCTIAEPCGLESTNTILLPSYSISGYNNLGVY